MRQAHRFSGTRDLGGGTQIDGPYRGLTKMTKGGPVWTGKVRLVPELLDAPLRWRKPRRIFVNSMSDLFHEDVPDEFIAAVFGVMAAAPHHTFQVLTKRAERMRAWFEWAARHPHNDGTGTIGGPDAAMWKALTEHTGTLYGLDADGDEGEALGRALDRPWPLPHVWLGVSVEDQKRADERIPLLLQTPAAVRWISAEPLLGPIDLRYLQPGDPPTEINAVEGTHGVIRPHRGRGPRLDWVVVGGESGPGARPMHPDWARSLRDQCAAAGVPYFFKQWGSWTPYCSTLAKPASFESNGITLRRTGKNGAGRLLDGREHSEYPR